MKWDKPTGSTQQTADGRYIIQQANSQHWVAYAASTYAIYRDLGTRPTDAQARELCEAEEARQIAAHRRAG